MKIHAGKRIFAVLMTVVLAAIMHGCGEKKETTPPPVETTSSSETKALPVLSQNEIPSPPTETKPDDSFDLPQVEKSGSPEETRSTSLSD